MSSTLEEIQRGSPLVEFLAEHPPTTRDLSRGVEMCELAFWGHVNLRGDSGDEAFQAGVESVVGVRVPAEPNTVARAGENAIAWLGPDEWLVISHPDSREGISAMLSDALAGLHVSVNDISSGQTIIRLRGARARDLLSKGCPIDLHPRAFGPGQCAQSHIAKSNALIIQVDDEPTYDVVVRRSFADYLARWLFHSGMEYDIAVVAS
jgi:sarcosine oxidase subunit gamma